MKENVIICKKTFADFFFLKQPLFVLLLIGRYDKRRFSAIKKLPHPANLLQLQVQCFRKGILPNDLKLILRKLLKEGLIEELYRENNVPFYGVDQAMYMRFVYLFCERHYYHTFEMLLDDMYNDTFIDETCPLWEWEFPVNSH